MPPSTTQAPLEASFLVGASRAQQPRALGDQAQCSSPVSGAPLLVSHRRMARVDARHRSDSRTVDDSPVETIATSVARSIAPRASKKKAVTVRGVNPRKRIQKKTEERLYEKLNTKRTVVTFRVSLEDLILQEAVRTFRVIITLLKNHIKNFSNELFG